MAGLNGARVLLGVTGGIAAYKAPEVVRRLRDAGAEVQVVLTRGAAQFVTALTFQAVSGRAVRSELFDSAAEAAMGHIELARWADFVLIAPASADCIARLAAGRADDLLSTLCLASDRPLALAPAMNRLMWAHPATQANVAALAARGVHIWGPGEGDQACGEVGAGRLLEPTELAARVGAALANNGPLKGVRVLVTAGPTREAIDPVRYVSNRSSGKMGYAVAAAAARAGAEVVLVSGPVALATPPGVARVDVESAREMFDAAMERAGQADWFVATAAVADYRPASAAAQKIKKRDEVLRLELERTDDILAAVARRYPEVFTIGFAAETHNLEEYAERKRREKALDMVAANWVGEGRGFDRDDNALWVCWEGGQRALPAAPKDALARDLIELAVERYGGEKSRD